MLSWVASGHHDSSKSGIGTPSCRALTIFFSICRINFHEWKKSPGVVVKAVTQGGSMAGKNLTLERGAVTLLTVNRPVQRNAIDFSTMDELEEALTVLDSDEALRVLVLTGGGDTFVSGGDLKEVQVLVTAEDGKRMAR